MQARSVSNWSRTRDVGTARDAASHNGPVTRRAFSIGALAVALLSGCSKSSSSQIIGDWIRDGHPVAIMHNIPTWTALQLRADKTLSVTYIFAPSEGEPHPKPRTDTGTWTTLEDGNINLETNHFGSIEFKAEIHDEKLYLSQPSSLVESMVFHRKAS